MHKWNAIRQFRNATQQRNAVYTNNEESGRKISLALKRTMQCYGLKFPKAFPGTHQHRTHVPSLFPTSDSSWEYVTISHGFQDFNYHISAQFYSYEVFASHRNVISRPPEPNGIYDESHQIVVIDSRLLLKHVHYSFRCSPYIVISNCPSFLLTH